MNFKRIIMKAKILITLFLVSSDFVLGQWNDSGNNYTTGKLGIGTTSLSIGYTGVNDLVIGDASWSEGFVINANSNNDGIMAFASDGNMVARFIYNNPTEKLHYYKTGKGNLMTIDGNGKVGIGTENTGNHKLAVEGSIGAREIKVETNGWSDFVFKKDYDLPTLQQVEKHIEEKGHLKDIPSAKEVAENGIFLGEMDSKLLQKIEELTLYTIQQEKKIDKQADEIAELKSLVKQLLASKNKS